nr:DUF2285 domain-containing protein [Mesorhizobium sp. B2-7-2]
MAHRQHLPDARLTAAQRRRLGHMLRCLDDQEEHASHFEVATALFGRRLVSAADWHDSAFQYQTHRLVRDGLKMVERGYRQLLRATAPFLRGSRHLIHVVCKPWVTILN